ncbi:hypothetical protein C3L33_10484, partial [Rhododendron williamsianum]
MWKSWLMLRIFVRMHLRNANWRER